MKRPKKRYVALGVLAVLVASYTTYRVIVGLRLQRQIEAYRALGYPVSGEELNGWYAEPPEGENAADEYLKAFAAFSEDGIDFSLLPVSGDSWELPRHEPLPQEVLDEVGRFLELNATALDHLHRAAQMPECRFPVDFEKVWEYDNITLSLDLSADARCFARLLWEKALYLRDTGNYSGAAEAVEDSLALTRDLALYPQTMSYVVAVAIEGLGVSAFRDLLSGSGYISEDDIARLQQALVEADNTEGLKIALWSQLPEFWEWTHMGIWPNFSEFVMFFKSNPAQATVFLAYSYLGASASDIEYLVGVIPQLLALTDKPYYEASGNIEAILTSDVPPSFFGFFSQWSMVRGHLQQTITESTFTIAARRSAYLRAAYTSAAVERYRIHNESLPDALDALVPKFLEKVPVDPFDGQPMRYQVHDKGYVVYSFGKDKKDDGGYDFENAEEIYGDVSFYVYR